MIKEKIFIGTSGWMYKDWGKKFYPKELKKDFLQFYAEHFFTVEINSSFYRMPSEKTFSLWNKNTPKNFVFAVKINRFITHRKRLILDDESKSFLLEFLKRTQKLEKKLSVILIQLPPSMKNNLSRLSEFLEFYGKIMKELAFKPLTAMEFRHDSWQSNEVFEMLRKHSVSMVFPASPFLEKEIFTSDFVYIRMHGDQKHSSNYQNKYLDELKNLIEEYPKNIKRVYVYFNNDYSAYAIDNALYLFSILHSQT